MTRRYYILDVFTETPFAGNPLAVVLDGDGLDDARMQAIAREFNLSETVFVREPRDPVNTAAIRIFTPASELPFAGHPTVGTAALLAQTRAPDLLGARDIAVVLEEGVGPVHCTVRARKGRAVRASFELPRLPEAAGKAPAAEDIAAALGLTARDIGFDGHVPSVYSAGSPFIFAPLSGLEAIGKARPQPGLFERTFGGFGRGAVWLYTRDTMLEGSHVHARMFAPKLGIAEDPATGSALAAFAGAAMRFEKPEDGDHLLIVEQGFEMGRPSLMMLEVIVRNGGLVGASIGGGVVTVMQGTLEA